MKYRFAHFALVLALLAPWAAWSRVSVSINIGPPPLLAYVQPMVPGEGYIWTPGYWAWSPRHRAYYWVPGTWVLAPVPGYLWTPGYWAFEGGGYLWHLGYWGPYVGFYGGINYGWGYGGYGYDGGRWNGGVFSYNRAYSNVNPAVVQSVYSTRVGSNYRNAPHVSYNGGRGGVAARPNAAQLQAQRAPHAAPAPVQIEHERLALATSTQKAAVRGAPRIAATPRPSAFTEPGVVPSRSQAAARPAPARDTRHAPDTQVHRAPPVEHAQQAPRAERHAQVRPESAALPRAPHAERGQPQAQGQGRGRGKEKQHEER